MPVSLIFCFPEFGAMLWLIPLVSFLVLLCMQVAGVLAIHNPVSDLHGHCFAFIMSGINPAAAEQGAA